MRSAQITVNDSTPTLLSEYAASREQLNVRLPSGMGNDVYLGASDVTDSTGFVLSAGNTIKVDLEPGDSLYAICSATQSATVHVLSS